MSAPGEDPAAGKSRIRGSEGMHAHLRILRLQGLDALGNITIIDVGAVHLHEVLEGG